MIMNSLTPLSPLNPSYSLYSLPSTLLCVIYEYDGTYRQYFQNKVLEEFQSKYSPILIIKRYDGLVLQYSVGHRKSLHSTLTLYILNGPYKEFKSNENDYSLLSSCYYKNGFKVGRQRKYFCYTSKISNTNIPLKIWEEKYYSIEKGKSIMTGRMRQYYMNGRINNEIYRDENGKRHGRSASYFDNGQVWTECFYKDDMFHGLYRVFYPSGISEEIIEFEHGVMHGMYRKYNKDGTLQLRYPNVRGKRHGKYEYWVNANNLKTSWYVNGKLLKKKILE